MDPHRSENDTIGAQPRGCQDTKIWHVARWPENMVAEHKRCESIGQRYLHVPSKHRPDDQPSRSFTGGR